MVLKFTGHIVILGPLTIFGICQNINCQFLGELFCQNFSCFKILYCMDEKFTKFNDELIITGKA